MKLLLLLSLLLGSVAFAETGAVNASPVTTAGVQVDCDADSGGVCPVPNAVDNLRIGDSTNPISSPVSSTTEGAQ